MGARDDRPDYDYLDGLVLKIYPTSHPQAPARRVTTVTAPDGSSAEFTVERGPQGIRVTSPSKAPWSVDVIGAGSGGAVAAVAGSVVLRV